MIQLSDHFTYPRLMRFVLPSIGMMVFTSIYGVVDGFFVSNFAGDTAFAGLNLIMPFIMLFSALGFMIGAGGTAYVSMRLGEGREKEANEAFSLLVYMVIIVGLSLALLGEIFLPQVARALGASDELMPYCITYGRISLVSITAFMLQNMFQTFMVAAEKPKLGLILTIVAGITNMVLDAVLVGLLRFGVAGAASATAITECFGGLVPLIYFLMPNSSRLSLGKTRLDFSVIWKSCTNGASEFMTNVSMAAVNMLYNYQLMKLAGANGVSAYGVIMYVSFVFVASFIGYSIGTAPLVSYNLGAKNYEELQNIYKKSLKLIGVAAVSMVILANVLAKPLAIIFVGHNTELMELTRNALQIYGLAFLFDGFNIYGSSFFTALNNGAVSAAISFLRTLLFQVIFVMTLPGILGINGVWFSVPVTEVLSLCFTTFFWIKMRKRYHYI